MSEENAQSVNDAQIELTELCSLLNCTLDELEERIKAHNDRLKSGEGFGEGTLRNIFDRQLIALREKATRQRLIAFLEAQKGANNVDDAEVARTIAQIQNAKSAKRSRQHSARSTASTPQRPVSIAPDLSEFATALTRYVSTKNRELEEVRNEFSGHFLAIRKTTDQEKQVYYKEPCFFGGADKTSWMLTTAHGVARGFSFMSAGLATSVLWHRHKMRSVGFRIMQYYFDENDDDEYIQGISLRLSERQHRPTTSQMLLKRLDPTDSKIAAYEQCALQDDKKAAEAQTIVVPAGSDEYAAYEALGFRESLKSFEVSEWQKKVAEAFKTEGGSDPADTGA